MSDKRCGVCGGLVTRRCYARFHGTCGDQACVRTMAERRRINGMGRPK